ncbi:MAG: transposase [Gammaproteobacteria bacterium]|nr:transposase [Gammaproteobacteria bacterium]
MGRRRRKFSREFKLEVVRLVIENGYSASQVARNLDLAENLVWRWTKELRPDLTQDIVDGTEPKSKDARLRQQDSENERLQRERSFLRKAVAFFVK